jgi:hypothetical protein
MALVERLNPPSDSGFAPGVTEDDLSEDWREQIAGCNLRLCAPGVIG